MPDNLTDIAYEANYDVKAGISDSFYLHQTGAPTTLSLPAQLNFMHYLSL